MDPEIHLRDKICRFKYAFRDFRHEDLIAYSKTKGCKVVWIKIKNLILGKGWISKGRLRNCLDEHPNRKEILSACPRLEQILNIQEIAKEKIVPAVPEVDLDKDKKPKPKEGAGIKDEESGDYDFDKAIAASLAEEKKIQAKKKEEEENLRKAIAASKNEGKKLADLDKQEQDELQEALKASQEQFELEKAAWD